MDNFFGSFGETEEEALAVLLPYVNKALLAQDLGDYKTFIGLITEDLRDQLTEEVFKDAHEKILPALGTYVEKDFLGSLKKDGNPILIFRARYSVSEDDILITVAVQNETNPPQFDGFWIN